MLHPAQKIVFATLVLAIGWGLSWPFRKASHPVIEPSANVHHQPTWNTLTTDRNTLVAPTALARNPEESQIPGTLIHATRTARQATPSMNSLSATAATSKMVPPPRGLDRPQVRQVAKPVTLIPISQHSKPPEATQQGHPPKGALAISRRAISRRAISRRAISRRAISRRAANGLPTSMPNHYEPGYSFPPKNGPHGPGISSEEYRPHPAYATVTDRLAAAGNTASQWPNEILHEIQNSDTLEKLAQHYLGDSARALEIFDLNRDRLKNPEILPIGAELRIPATGRRTGD